MTAWNDFWAGVPVATAVTWIVAAGAGIGFLWKGWPFLRKFVKVTEALITLPDDMAGMRKDLAQIKHEVLPNGGSSLKDQTTRTEAAVAELGTQVAHVRRQQASTKTTLARTEKTLTEHLAATPKE